MQLKSQGSFFALIHTRVFNENVNIKGDST